MILEVDVWGPFDSTDVTIEKNIFWNEFDGYVAPPHTKNPLRFSFDKIRSAQFISNFHDKKHFGTLVM